MLSNLHGGKLTLAQDDVFYFGHTTGTPLAPLDFRPTLQDVTLLPVGLTGQARLQASVVGTTLAQPWKLALDWGDGSPPELVEYAAGLTTFTANHTYPLTPSTTWAALYADDFATDPHWLTNDPARYQWNASDAVYALDTSAADGNIHFGYQPVRHAGQWTQLSWDVLVTAAELNSSLSFGLFDAQHTASANREFLTFHFDTAADGQRSVSLRSGSVTQGIQTTSVATPFLEDTWYHVALTYDATTRQARATLTDRATGLPVAAGLTLTLTQPLTPALDYLGSSTAAAGAGVNGSAIAQLDNVQLQVPANTYCATLVALNGDVESVPVEVGVNLLPWQNRMNQVNVNGDGYVSPQDALIVINTLNAAGNRADAAATGPVPDERVLRCERRQLRLAERCAHGDQLPERASGRRRRRGSVRQRSGTGDADRQRRIQRRIPRCDRPGHAHPAVPGRSGPRRVFAARGSRARFSVEHVVRSRLVPAGHSDTGPSDA